MAPSHRPIYLLLSSRMLSYAGPCLESLFRNCLDSLSVSLLTDDPEDKAALTNALGAMAIDSRHTWAVYDRADCDARAVEQFCAVPERLAVP